MSSQPPAGRSRYDVETPVLGRLGKAVIHVDTKPGVHGHRWDAEVGHPLVAARRHGFAPSRDRAAIEAVGWLSAAAAALERAELVLHQMVKNREKPEAPSPRM